MATASLLVALERTTDRFKANLGRVPQLIRFVEFPPHDRSRAEILAGLTSDEIRGWAYTFPDMLPYIEKYGPRDGYWRWFKSLRPKLKQMLYQQSLVFIMSSFEVYVKDAVKLVLQHVPTCLTPDRARHWKKQFDLGFDDVFHANWAKMTEAFDTLFLIDLTQLLDHQYVVEVFEIRHAIIHNLGTVDKRFINKVKSSNLGIEYRVGDVSYGWMRRCLNASRRLSC